ncbi:MAG TPA: suppressor of fused domain protein [Candidatus Acidoferrum sp.]|nr:suppressor of fused domain protein [Candidatus Acidoferrum sp.]
MPTPIRYLDEIDAHITRRFGKNSFVLHEEKSSTVHVDIHVVMPSPDRPFYTLLTSGMSDLDMTVPEGAEGLALAEVCLCLPEYWPLNMTNFGWREPNYFWPIGILKQAARYPHVCQTWLGWGHSVPRTPAPDATPDEARFTGMLFVPPQTFAEGADEVATRDGRTIRYLALIPLLPPELAFKRTFGLEKLEEQLIRSEVTELLDPHRPSVVKPN